MVSDLIFKINLLFNFLKHDWPKTTHEKVEETEEEMKKQIILMVNVEESIYHI